MEFARDARLGSVFVRTIKIWEQGWVYDVDAVYNAMICIIFRDLNTLCLSRPGSCALIVASGAAVLVDVYQPRDVPNS